MSARGEAAPGPHRIRRAGVLGAGVMGARIAAHLANAGVPTRLLDVSGAAARDGLDRAARESPDPFFTTSTRALVETAGFDEGLPALASADWIVEAIIEDLNAKRALLGRVDAIRSSDAIVSSNTSGIPLSEIADGLSEGFRRHWLGTHFFNPPRYLPLLELIPTIDTDPRVLARMTAFADVHLGKGVVVARDRPGFIANRIALFGVARTLEIVAGGAIGIADVDALTGPLLGRPKTATFRTLDLAGLDILVHVARDLAARLHGPGPSTPFDLPDFVHALVARGSTGAKAGQGFYRKDRSGVVEVVDPVTLTYGPVAPTRLEGVDAARGLDDAGARIRRLFLADTAAGRFLRQTLGSLLVYAARVQPEVAASIDDVDRAMRWGFGWEIGPFETWDAIGIDEAIEACGMSDLPATVVEARARGGFRARTPAVPGRGGAQAAGTPGTPGRLPPASDDGALLPNARARGVVRRNASASLVDLGDGVLLVELHSKMNALGGDAIEMLSVGVAEAEARFAALVVGTGGTNFSAGANLMLLLLEAQEGNWDEVDLMVRAFQRATTMLQRAAVPVVAAPAGLALGGGCEICLHATRVEAAAETYMGLVETGVGLIPAGGGTKEMMGRADDACPAGADIQPFAQRVFETIAFARVSTSAAHARELGYLRPSDGIRMNRERLLAGAKGAALALADGYVPAAARPGIRVGGASVLAALTLGVHLAWRAGRITDHDALIGRTLARVVAGGSLTHAAALSEAALLDLEREAFLSLCGEPRTLERIAHTLRTGKPLRN